MTTTTYRGWRIDSWEGTQMGHTTNAGTLARAGIGTKRKVKCWEVHYPHGGSTTLDTLRAAKQYIDRYLDS